MLDFQAYCEEYNTLNNFKSLDLSEVYRNYDHPLSGPTVLKHKLPTIRSYFIKQILALKPSKWICVKTRER